MKDHRPNKKMINPGAKSRPPGRSTSGPHIFPPIEGIYGRELTHVSNEPGPEAFKDGAQRSKFPIPPRYVLYRKWELIAQTAKGTYTLKEHKPELTKSQTVDVIPSKTKRHSVIYPIKPEIKKSDQLQRTSISVTGKEIKEIDNTRLVRKKIEQFRHWHDKQYKLKLDILKARVNQEKENRKQSPENIPVARKQSDQQVAPPQPMHEKQLSEKPLVRKRGMKIQDTSRVNMEQLPKLQTGCLINTNFVDMETDTTEPTSQEVQSSSRPESPPAPVPDELKSRLYSPHTWRSWRDVNDSYAYTNVKSYIEENDLLEKDKEKEIKNWVAEVEKARMSGVCVGPDGSLIPVTHNDSLSDSSSTSDE